MGVKEYGSQKSKTVRFSQSFGLNYTGGLITPFLPDKFSIKCARESRCDPFANLKVTPLQVTFAKV